MNNLEKRKFYGAVTVGERGQIVVPAQIRKLYKINAGDRLIVFAKPEMIGLMPAEEFERFLHQAEQFRSQYKKG